MSSPEPGTDFAAIIAAGGSGSRFAGENSAASTPKQFLKLRGLPLYAWSLLEIARHEKVRKIIFVTPSHMVKPARDEIADLIVQYKIRPEIQVITGGASRQGSVFNGLKTISILEPLPEFVLIHDAARPFLDFATVDHVIKKAIEYGACTVGGSVSDTIKRVSEGKIVETIPRDSLIAVQTPQSGRLNHLLDAHEKAVTSGYASTDDAALLEWAGHNVYVVEGPRQNMKVTQPLDLILAEALGDILLSDRL